MLVLLLVQYLVALPLPVFAAFVGLTMVSCGFLTARSYARHYRFARLRIGRALKTSLGTGLGVGTIVVAGSLLLGLHTYVTAWPAQQFVTLAAACLGLCIVLTELGALAAAMLFTWRAHLHTVS